MKRKQRDRFHPAGISPRSKSLVFVGVAKLDCLLTVDLIVNATLPVAGQSSAVIERQPRRAVTLQHGDFKDCVVPTWRISDKEPTDMKKGPAIPAEAKWKFNS